MRRFLRSPVSGGVGAGLTALWEGFWLIGPPVGVDSASQRAYLFWGLIALVICVGQAFVTMYRRIQTLEEHHEPKFEMVFAPGTGDDENNAFLEVTRHVEHSGRFGDRAVAIRTRKYRVGIVNLSAKTIPGVRLVLAKCTPCTKHHCVRLNHRLAVMDSDPVIGERDLPPNPDGQPTLFFDVVVEFDDDKITPQRFGFAYADLKASRLTAEDVADEEYAFRITLRAEGGGYSCERDFRVFKAYNPGNPPGWNYYPVVMEPL